MVDRHLRTAKYRLIQLNMQNLFKDLFFENAYNNAMDRVQPKKFTIASLSIFKTG